MTQIYVIFKFLKRLIKRSKCVCKKWVISIGGCQCGKINVQFQKI